LFAQNEEPGVQDDKETLSIAILAVIFLLAMSGLAFADTWTDISEAAWQDVYHVSATEAAMVADGYPNGTFRPNQAVTRGQLAKMVADGLDIPLADPATVLGTVAPGPAHATRRDSRLYVR
jgi:hypothetical protein